MKDPWYASKRLWGALLLVGATVAANFGIDIDPETQTAMVDNVTTIGSSIAAVIGAALAVWSKAKE